jgi:hypothetical protein
MLAACALLLFGGANVWLAADDLVVSLFGVRVM